MKSKYKQAIETLVSAQELVITYSKRDIFNKVCWGILFLAVAFFYTFSSVWINVVLLVIGGINFHTAATEHEFLETWRRDLTALKQIKERNRNI